MDILYNVIKVVLILILSPLAGGLLTGIDRKLSARMQRRKGPPLLQPFYDVAKLMRKESTTVNYITQFYVTFSLCFYAFTVVLFFVGVDLLLCVFAFTLACIFFVIAGYSSYSPFSLVGTERELIQIMCYEPMVLITVFGYYEVTGTFSAASALSLPYPAIVRIPLIFLGFCYVLTIKLRKSPFDFSMSHHGHQEIVKGITTELTGINLAMVEISHWFETVFSLALLYILLVWSAPYSHILAAALCLLIFFLEILIDNAFARIKWRPALRTSWIVTGLAGGINLFVLNLIR